MLSVSALININIVLCGACLLAFNFVPQPGISSSADDAVLLNWAKLFGGISVVLSIFPVVFLATLRDKIVPWWIHPPTFFSLTLGLLSFVLVGFSQLPIGMAIAFSIIVFLIWLACAVRLLSILCCQPKQPAKKKQYSVV